MYCTSVAWRLHCEIVHFCISVCWWLSKSHWCGKHLCGSLNLVCEFIMKLMVFLLCTAAAVCRSCHPGHHNWGSGTCYTPEEHIPGDAPKSLTTFLWLVCYNIVLHYRTVLALFCIVFCTVGIAGCSGSSTGRFSTVEWSDDKPWSCTCSSPWPLAPPWLLTTSLSTQRSHSGLLCRYADSYRYTVFNGTEQIF